MQGVLRRFLASRCFNVYMTGGPLPNHVDSLSKSRIGFLDVQADPFPSCRELLLLGDFQKVLEYRKQIREMVLLAADP